MFLKSSIACLISKPKHAPNTKYEMRLPVKKPPIKQAVPTVNKNVSLKRNIDINTNKFMTFIFNSLICLNIQIEGEASKPPRKVSYHSHLSIYPYILLCLLIQEKLATVSFNPSYSFTKISFIGIN